MKNRHLFLLCMCLLGVNVSLAQITISSSDVSGAVAPGNSAISYSDSTTAMLNIGTTGSSSCNFSSLVPGSSYAVYYVPSSSTPNASDFPASTSTMFYTYTSSDSTKATVYAYARVDTACKNLGMVMYTTPAAAETIMTKTVYDPWAEGFLLPLTYGKSWTRSYTTTVTVVYMGVPLPFGATIQDTVQVTVDAYGTVTFPGGTTEDCLRMRLDKRSWTSSMFGPATYQRAIQYCWSGKSGNTITTTAVDTTSPDHGTIAVNGICWALRGMTAVEVSAETPTAYALSRNYPNPFNPSTTLTYSMPAQSHVSLKVFDILGREVATLYEGRQEAGVHHATWNAGNMASGIFFARLSVTDERGAARYAGVTKMLLMK